MNNNKKTNTPVKKIILLFMFVLILKNISAYTWQNVVMMGGGFVPGLVYSPVSQNLLYARTDVGGFYRWNSSTSTWIPLTDMYGPLQGSNFGGESIAPDPVNANIVYAAAGTGSYGTILSSTNQGASWTSNPIAVSIAANNDGREAGERLVVDPNLDSKLYFGSRWQGLWVSTNSAASWSQVTSFPVLGDSGYGIAWVIFPPPTGGYGHPSGAASVTIYAGVMAMSSGNSNIYRSTNSGTSWSLISGGPANMITTHASLGSDGNLWIVYDSGGYGPNSISTGQIWKLNTSTLAWTNVTPSNGPASGSGGYAGISVDPENASHAVVTTIDWWSGPDRLFSTTNGGTSWTIIALAGSSYSSFNDNGAVYTTACGSGTQGGTGWAGCVAIDPFNSNNAIYPSGGAAPGGGVWSSTNIEASPVDWTFTDMGLEEGVCIYLNPAAAGGILFSCMGDFGGMRHTNLAQSPAGGMYCNPQFSNTNMLDFAENNTNDVVRVGNSGAVTSDIAYSTNNGQSWTPWGSAPPGYTTDNEMEAVAVSADGSHVVVSPYSGYGSPAYATSLGGAWTTCSGLPSGACVASDRVNASIFYAVSPSNWVYGGTVTVYESTNSGATFSQVNTISVNWSDPNGDGQFIVPRPVFGETGEFWVCTYNNLYRFTNGGSSVTTISNVYEPFGVGFGKAASGQTHPAVFLSGSVNGTYGFYRCDDGAGTTWTQINDSNHQFSGAGWVEGDETTYGLCYFGAGARGILYCYSGVTATATSTAAITATSTGTPAITATRTYTPTFSATSTYTRTITPTLTSSLTSTGTNTPVNTATLTATGTSTATRTNTSTNTQTLTPTPTPTNTATGTVTLTFTITVTSTSTDTPVVSITPTYTPTVFTWTITPTVTVSPSITLTDTPLPTGTFTASATCTVLSATLTATGTDTLSVTATKTSTATDTPTNTATGTVTLTFTITVTSTSTNTPVVSITPTYTATIFTATITPTYTPSASATCTVPSATLTATSTASATCTVLSATPTATSTASATGTDTLSVTATKTSTATDTPTNTATGTVTLTFTITVTSTSTNTPVVSITPTYTATVFTWTITPTVTVSPTITLTDTPLPTGTFTASATCTVLSATITATGTASATCTVPGATPNTTSTPTPTATAIAPAGVLTIGPIKPYPNPLNPVTWPLKIAVNVMPNDVDSITVKIYTTAYRLIREEIFEGTAVEKTENGVIVQYDSSELIGLSSGTYYYAVIAEKGGARVRSKIDKIIILK